MLEHVRSNLRSISAQIVRTEIEPKSIARERKLIRTVIAEEKYIQARRLISRVTDNGTINSNHFAELSYCYSEYVIARVEPTKQDREIVLFNRISIPLPPKASYY